MKDLNPRLSIVIGSHNARSSIGECLTVLESQRNGQEVEIIVVDNSTDGTAEIVRKQFQKVKLIRSPALNFIPELWESGINQSAGDIIAITTAHCVPRKNWIEEILKAHEAPYPGIGGAIENEGDGGLVEWAIYFCRYTRYMLPFGEETVDDFAADNASYKRWALDRCRDTRRNGFWEPLIHAELRRNGLQLLMTPAIVVYCKKSFSVLGFIKQRFWHGRQFGRSRALNISGTRRLFFILLSPLIPGVLLSRFARRIFEKKRHFREFLLSLPILTLFLISWSLGEWTGYLWISKNRE
jgi:glycosyltransferase involved in cell wall biosynthesis